MLPHEIQCSGSFPLDKLPKEEQACKRREKKCCKGGNFGSEADMQNI